jgi:hypothetical protein
MNKNIEYDGNNIILIKVNDYMVSVNDGIIRCSCSVKHKRDYRILCKHIKYALNVVDKDNNKLL